MARRCKNLAGDLERSVESSLEMLEAVEAAAQLARRGTKPSPSLYAHRIELFYEMGFLRMFIAWENFLEQSFYRYLCGHRNANGVEPIVPPAPFRTIQDAEAHVLNNKPFVLWHSPSRVWNRAHGMIPGGLHEQVIGSNIAALDRYGAVRHRIAHAQADARIKFDQASMRLTGKRYRGARPGKLLRDWYLRSAPIPKRWVEMIGDEFVNLGYQIVP